MIASTIKEVFGREYLKHSAVRDRDEALFYEMVARGYSGGVIAEVGTHKGASTVLLATFSARVITLDVADHPEKYELWRHFGVTDKIEFRQGGVETLRGDDEFGFAFVDGDHSYGNVANDFQAVRKCGSVLFHDYGDSFKGVRDFVNGIKDGILHIEKPFALWMNHDA